MSKVKSDKKVNESAEQLRLKDVKAGWKNGGHT